MDPSILKYKEELIELLHKSNEAFEKQLSYITAGCLALSIGFIKDIVKDLPHAQYKWSLEIGWILLGITLLINCISHIRAASLFNKTIAEINTEDCRDYDDTKVTGRFREINRTNWLTVGSMIGGISLIIFFIIKNIYNG
ncbi:MAG: hypothetical protein JWM28_2047 [Chitinophagaceae bacterium]|nr:hypothetical protein [Chitinophagaceae bacterium]